MNQNILNYLPRHSNALWRWTVTVITVLVMTIGNFAPFASTTALAATNTLTLNVISARTDPRAFGGAGVTAGDAVTEYQYIINIDNTGTTEQRAPTGDCSPSDDAAYPENCNWTSIAGIASSSPIYTQGDQSDFVGGLDLPDGRYLISVLADGYKLDGAHFSVPLDGPVTVAMQPFPLPDATIRARVFQDNAPTNSAPDMPAEQGLAGFVGHIKDYIGEVTTDVYGNPLCTQYEGEDPVTFTGAILDADFLPIAIPGTGGQCLSDSNGDLVIPHLGPGRYALLAVRPEGTNWVQTTTLEGNQDWDWWAMEGSTGFDTEFVVAGEPFPAAMFGFVQPTNSLGGGGEIKGLAMSINAYWPPVGGITGEPGLLGGKADYPIDSPWVALSDLNGGDTAVYIGQGNPDGTFNISNVPDGDYALGVWDEPQNHIFNFSNVSVRNGETVDLGTISMMGWWTTLDGYVFSDDNENGIMDNGEAGIPNFPLVMRKRDNTVMDRGSVAITTDANGYYYRENAYPMTQWLIEEAYADGFRTTGITFQADNQPEPTTVLGSGVDVNVLPIIGLGGRLDWGVKAYSPGTNGGIVGTVSYDTTRNELDPSLAAVEDWQPGVPNITVSLYAPVACPGDNTPCDANGFYALNEDGSYMRGPLLNQVLTETWERPRGDGSPTGCVARNVDGIALAPGIDEQVLPLDPSGECLEAPLMGVQYGPLWDGENFAAAVDGNYGFGDGCFEAGGFDPDTGLCVSGDFAPLTPGNYLVELGIPTEGDVYGPSAVHPTEPLYKVTREEDINIGNGDQFIPQVPPPACAGALHTVDVATIDTDVYPAVVGAGYDINGLPVGVNVPASTPTVNATFADLGGTLEHEGKPKPLCDVKLVKLDDQRSIAPTFNLFTDVPIPGRFSGLIVDDLNFSSDPKSILYGEKAGVAFAPVGIYDYANRLMFTAESDYNGMFDVLMPSTNRINCPSPSGVCAGMYRFVGNDPGIPGRWNPNYNPQFRTIAAEFEAFPGALIPTDLAPTQVGVGVQIPGSQTLAPVSCTLDAAQPQFFAINKPYIYNNQIAGLPTFTIAGVGFGATQGTGSVKLDGTAMNIVSWSDTQIQFTLPTSGMGPNPYRLSIRANNGQSTVNGLTFHVINSGGGGGGGAYNPTVFEVGPGKPYATIQVALEAAAGASKALVVVYPGASDLGNPRYNGRGAYYENLIMHSPAKLQGVGPGGVYPDGTPAQGSIIDGIAFGGDTNLAEAWRVLIQGLTWVGNQNISEGAGIYVLAASTDQFGSNYRASIDGFDIRGGNQMGFPGNLNAIFGGFPNQVVDANLETQGGAIFVNGYARYLQITNNVIENNGGAYGTIRIGTPNLPAPDTDNQNDNVRIANNRILANGGTNLAGALGIFNGADNYEVANNDFCGNFSAEYGGGISHYGRSNNGSIHDNRIYFNRSYDEGAGIMIAGELPVDPGADYGTPDGAQGSGAVNIFNNLIQANLSDDDGGGLRFLMAGNFPMNVYNNMIVNNISTHEGGGVALDDAPDVRFYNNTVMKNITTATAVTSDGQPAPAGLSTGQNSAQLQNTLGGGSTFSDPLLFNNIFADNRAGTRSINTVTGIGIGGPLDIDLWDMGSLDPSIELSPTNSIFQSTLGTLPGAGNLIGADPTVIATHDVGVAFASWRTNINFIGAILVTADLPPNLMGNYHMLDNTSPAYNSGAASKLLLSAPAFDIDNQIRPGFGAFDMGADEIPDPTADLSITKTDGVTTALTGMTLTYTITASNAGADYTTATVADSFPANLTNVSWTCAPANGASCPVSDSGNINAFVNLPAGGSVVFTVTATVSPTATGTLSNTATVTGSTVGVIDPNPGNNTATDTDTIVPSMHVGDLDVTTTNSNATTWSATVRITAHDASHNLVPGAVVTGSWVGGGSGGTSCTTSSTAGPNFGTCTVTRTGLSKPTAPSAAFTVGNVTKSGNGYLSSANHDPDIPVDSSGTVITATLSTMHVVDLDWTNATLSATQWRAFVTIIVLDGNGNPVSGALVTGTWSAGNTSGRTLTCTTNASGICQVQSGQLSRTTNLSVNFTVTNVTKSSGSPAITYQSSANSDTDVAPQNSTGTVISVPRP